LSWGVDERGWCWDAFLYGDVVGEYIFFGGVFGDEGMFGGETYVLFIRCPDNSLYSPAVL
jgi:hypothetical protein